MRRLLRGGVILAPAPVGIADHADIAVAPILGGDPLDQVVAIGALVFIEQRPSALRIPGAAALRHHMDVAVRDVETGGAGFDRVAPMRRLLLNVLRIGREREQHRISPALFRLVHIHGQLDAIAHRHAHALGQAHAIRGHRGTHEFLGIDPGHAMRIGHFGRNSSVVSRRMSGGVSSRPRST